MLTVDAYKLSAGMAKLVDAYALGAYGVTRKSANLFTRTRCKPCVA